MKKSIIHISHTDITRDARIIRELNDIKNQFFNYNIYAIGINKKSQLNNKKNQLKFIQDLSISLITSKLFFFPEFIRHFLSFVEFFIKTIFKIYKKKITIIHCHDFVTLPIGYFAKLLFKCKLVYDAHELESNTNNVRYSQVIFLIEKFMWKKIDLFITVAPLILNWYNKKFGYKKNSIVILNTPKIKKSIVKNSLRQKLKISKRKLIFIYVGILSYGRGIDQMLTAFSNPNINSHLVFLGYGELEHKVKKFSKKYNNIHILKPVTHNTLVKFISSADVGLCLIEKVSLSDYYSLPNKLFEYIFANLHIIASNFPSIKKIVRSFSQGDFIPVNANSLIQSIKLFESNKKKIKISKKNLANISWQVQSKKLISSYQNLLSHSLIN